MHGQAVQGGGRARGPHLADRAQGPRLRPRGLPRRPARRARRGPRRTHARHLGGKARELRFHLLAQQTRVTYWLAPGQVVVLLTTFRKTWPASAATAPDTVRDTPRHSEPS